MNIEEIEELRKAKDKAHDAYWDARNAAYAVAYAHEDALDALWAVYRDAKKALADAINDRSVAIATDAIGNVLEVQDAIY